MAGAGAADDRPVARTLNAATVLAAGAYFSVNSPPGAVPELVNGT
jgi:hypothetical protein